VDSVLRSRVQALLDYNPETGVFSWRLDVKGRARPPGKRAGCTNALGYVVIRVDDKLHYAHRLAWLVTHGSVPKGIDHINGDRGDNRLCNLRLADQRQNLRNKGKQANNRSGYKGVIWERRAGRWRADIRLETKSKMLGYFDTAEDAYAAYVTASRKYFGEFSRV
jgi:hypothetical protein